MPFSRLIVYVLGRKASSVSRNSFIFQSRRRGALILGVGRFARVISMPNWIMRRVFLRVARMSLTSITCLSDSGLWGFQSNSAAIHTLVSPQHSNFRSVSYILEAWITRGAYLACTVLVERDRVGPARVPAPVWLVAKEGDQGHAHVKDNGKVIAIATRVLIGVTLRWPLRSNAMLWF